MSTSSGAARIPRSAAMVPRLLRDAGYSTFALGKWHLVPRFEQSAAGPFERWPLGVGFELDMTAVENAYLNATLLGVGEEELETALPRILEFADLGDFVDPPMRH